MIATEVKYYLTPMLGYNGKDYYNLKTYHVAPLPKLADLTLEQAVMVADFMNKLKDDRSIRAIEARVRFSGFEGIHRLLKFRAGGGSLLFPEPGKDYLCLAVCEDAIVWTKDSILEEYENGLI